MPHNDPFQFLLDPIEKEELTQNQNHPLYRHAKYYRVKI